MRPDHKIIPTVNEIKNNEIDNEKGNEILYPTTSLKTFLGDNWYYLCQNKIDYHELIIDHSAMKIFKKLDINQPQLILEMYHPRTESILKILTLFPGYSLVLVEGDYFYFKDKLSLFPIDVFASFF